MSSIAVGGNAYRIGKLNAFQQFHVARRIAPVLSGLASAGDAGGFGPLAEALAHMPDTEMDFVLHTCLAVVAREQGSSALPIFVAGARDLQFADITMGDMVELAVAVIRENLGGFFSDLAAKVQSPAAATPGATG